MSYLGPREPSQQRLLPFVTEEVIDALHQDVLEIAESGTFEEFILNGFEVIQTENLGIAIILRNITEALEGDEGLTPEAKLLLGGALVYRMLRSQAEAERMNGLPVSEE